MDKESILIGAEKQCAVSIALANKKLEFLFVSMEPIIDGWDLPNVTIISYRKYLVNYKKYIGNSTFILNSKYQSLLHKDRIKNTPHSLIGVLSALHKHFQAFVLPVSEKVSKNDKTESLIVKGNFFHKPDAVEVIKASMPVYSEDKFNCKYVFQKYLSPSKTFMV